MYSMGNKGSKADSTKPGSGKICSSCEIYVEALCKPELWSHQQIPKRRLEHVVLESSKCPFCRLLWRATWRNAWNYQRGLIEDFLGSRGMRAVGNLDQPVKEPVKPEKWATHLWKDSGPSYECSVKAFDGLAPYLEYKISLLGSPVPVDLHQVAESVEVSSLGYGQVIKPTAFDPEVCKAWLEQCQSKHGSSCAMPWGVSVEKPSKLWVIDVQEECIVPLPSEGAYITLSYVWGRRLPPNARLAKTMDEFNNKLKQPRSISRYLSRCDATYRDSFKFVRSIGQRYLWIDFICIPPDPVIGKEQIMVMDRIYACSLFTIAAADGANSSAGLPGVTERPSSQAPYFWQVSERITPSLRVASTVPVPAFVNQAWNHRGWTFQEKLLSSRLVLFTCGQVLWQCSKCVLYEDGPSEHKSEHWLALERPLQALGRFVDLKAPQALKRVEIDPYLQVTSEYCRRQLTFANDADNAFMGLGRVFEKVWQTNMVFGLPELILNRALLWHREISASPNNMKKWMSNLGNRFESDPKELEWNRRPDRRKVKTSTKKRRGSFVLDVFERRSVNGTYWPSWSWMGWIGRIVYSDVDKVVKPLLGKWYIGTESTPRLLHTAGREPVDTHRMATTSTQLPVPPSTLLPFQLFTYTQCQSIEHFELGKPHESTNSKPGAYHGLYFEIMSEGTRVGHIMLTTHEEVEKHWFLILLSETVQEKGQRGFSPGSASRAALGKKERDSSMAKYSAGIPLYNIMVIEWKDDAASTATRVGLGIIQQKDWAATNPQWTPMILE